MLDEQGGSFALSLRLLVKASYIHHCDIEACTNSGRQVAIAPYTVY
jgi:hypothetical protein